MLPSRRGCAQALGVAIAAVLVWNVANGADMSEPPFRQRQRVPPFPSGLKWFNTTGPIELGQLRGKFVLLDFWTYCCINCMHILPELKKLERAYADSLVVIGVHSAKFTTERDAQNIVEAILRYEIEHPVVNDAEHAIWNRFGIDAWPSLVLVDPEGYAVWATSGEITFEQVDAILKAAIPYYRKKGLLDPTPLRFNIEAQRAPDTPLRFPGKVLADESGNRLFIADSNHNRIVVTRLDGSLLAIIGSGAVGRSDGDFATAEFNHPQGMALHGQFLFVADTENHSIRKVDLTARRVTTVSGTGRQARGPAPLRPTHPAKAALNSPWDLLVHGEDLYIAMAGSHQIWKMRLDGSSIGPYAGNGREDIVDGPLLPKQPYRLGYCSFAQPSGLASDGTWLYVADSEGSSIRAVPFDPRRDVKTVAGTAHLAYARLFTFGDVDGPGDRARFQHPLGIAYYEGRLYVADTYNNKIRVVDPATGATQTLVGTGQPGRCDDPPAFDEPAGISAAAGKLFVADTNNHLVRVVDLRSGNRVSTLAIAGLGPPKPSTQFDPRRWFAGATEHRLQPVRLRGENRVVRLQIDLALPPDHKINPLAPMTYLVEAVDSASKSGSGADRSKPAQLKKLDNPTAQFEIALPLDSTTGSRTLRVWLSYHYCRVGAEGLCKAGSVVWTVPLEIVSDAADAPVRLPHQVQ